MGQDGSKMAPGWAKVAPGWPQDKPKLLQNWPKWFQDGPMMAQGSRYCYCYLPNKSRQRRKERTNERTSHQKPENQKNDEGFLFFLGFFDHLGTSWAILRPSWRILGHLRAILGPSGPIFAISCKLAIFFDLQTKLGNVV